MQNTVKVEEINKKKKLNWMQTNKKWLFIGSVLLMLIIVVLILGSRKKTTELSKYLGMSESRLKKIMDLEYFSNADNSTLYWAENESILFKIADSDQRVHLILSLNDDYKLYGIEFGIGSSDMRHELEERGFEDQKLDNGGLFKKGKISVLYDIDNGYVSSFMISDNDLSYITELQSDTRVDTEVDEEWKTVHVDDGYLALRVEPTYDASNEIGKLYTGSRVKIVGEEQGDYVWVYSEDLDKEGWVNAGYIS